MSSPEGRPPAPPPPPPPPAYAHTPDAEKYVLEADAMRRRQLRSALIHGSARTWREHRRTWPGVVVGLIVVAVICGGLTIKDAFQQEQARKAAEERKQAQEQRERDQDEREREQESPTTAPSPGPAAPTASATPATPSTSLPVPTPSD